MKITVIGTGYVGLVSGTCLAEVGNDVLCLDLDPAKIKILEEGGIPIFEPGLQDMVKRNVAAGRLHFTTDIERAAPFGTVQFIAVGTPPDEDGSADMKYVTVTAYDPVASTEAKHCFPDEPALRYADNQSAALENADALVIVTEWKEFRSPDFAMLKTRLKAPVIFDGRNLYDPKMVHDLGFEYSAIGR